MGRMLSRRIEYRPTLRLNLWYTFDRRPMCGVDVWQSGKKITAAFIKAFRHTMSGGLISRNVLWRGHIKRQQNQNISTYDF